MEGDGEVWRGKRMVGMSGGQSHGKRSYECGLRCGKADGMGRSGLAVMMDVDVYCKIRVDEDDILDI